MKKTSHRKSLRVESLTGSLIPRFHLQLFLWDRWLVKPFHLASGDVKIAKTAIEIVDIPMKNI